MNMVIEIASGDDPYVSRTGIHVDPPHQCSRNYNESRGCQSLYFYTLDTSGFNENRKSNFSVNADGKYLYIYWIL